MNDDEIVLVLLGDVNLDGRTSVGDTTLLAQSFVGLYTFDKRECAQNLAADISKDGRVSVGDTTLLAQSFVDLYEFRWNVAE